MMTDHKLCALIVSFSLSISSSATAAEPWEGKWAADPSWCGNTSETTDAVPVVYSRRRMEGYENSCRVTDIRRIRSETRLSLACEGEGMSYTDVQWLRVSGNRLRVRDKDGSTVTFFRCK